MIGKQTAGPVKRKRFRSKRAYPKRYQSGRRVYARVREKSKCHVITK